MHDLKKNTSDCASHNRLHVYGFSDVVNLPGSSPGTALHWVPRNMSHKSFHKIAQRLSSNSMLAFVLISHMFLCTLSVRFRVEFSVGGMLFSSISKGPRYAHSNKTLPDSHTSVSYHVQTEQTLSTTHWTFHFENVTKNTRTNIL